MTRTIEVSRVRSTPATAEQRRRGLVAWVSFVLNEAVVVDGIAVRRTDESRLTLSYPRRADRGGSRHFVVRPLNEAARREIERHVFAQLGLQEANR